MLSESWTQTLSADQTHDENWKLAFLSVFNIAKFEEVKCHIKNWREKIHKFDLFED